MIGTRSECGEAVWNSFHTPGQGLPKTKTKNYSSLLTPMVYTSVGVATSPQQRRSEVECHPGRLLATT